MKGNHHSLNAKLRFLRLLVGPRSYILLLVSLFLICLLSAGTTDAPFTRGAFSFLCVFLIVSISIATSHAKKVVIAMFAGGLIVFTMLFTSNVLMVPPMHTKTLRMVSDILALLYVLCGAFLIIRDVFSGRINANRICGAICFYLMIGLCFGMFFFIMDLHDRTSFNIEEFYQGTPRQGLPITEHDRLTLFSYYSFCTITTAGFGDVTPISQAARTFSWMEAVFGQLYLSILVARLVGLHIVDSTAHGAQIKSREEAVVDFDPI